MHQQSLAALAELTEAPQARLRLRPSAEWSAAETHAARLLQLLAILICGQAEDDELIVAGQLAELDNADLQAFDAALLAIAAHGERRVLGISRRLLLQDLRGTSREERLLELIDRGHAYGRTVHRLLYWREGLVQRLEQQLSDYLDRMHAQVPDWPRRASGRPRSTDMPAAEPLQSSTFVKTCGIGEITLYVLREDERLSMAMDRWIARQRQTAAFSAAGCRSVATFADVTAGLRHANPNHLPGETVLGVLADGQTPFVPATDQFRSTRIDTGLAELASRYRWAYVSWSGTYHETYAAWISGDVTLDQSFESVLQRTGCAANRVSTYRGLGLLCEQAGGVQFDDQNAPGDAALLAAATDEQPPWLVAKLDHAGHWWRKATARLQAGALRVTDRRGWPEVYAAYRVTDLAAYREIWQRHGRGDSIALATVCGRDPAVRVLDSFVRDGWDDGFQRSNALSQRHGWTYGHTFGGGASENFALFHAQDPTLTRRIVATALGEQEQRFFLLGRW